MSAPDGRPCDRCGMPTMHPDIKVCGRCSALWETWYYKEYADFEEKKRRMTFDSAESFERFIEAGRAALRAADGA